MIAMHKMDNTPKIITIIGLILEGFGLFGFGFGYIILNSLKDSSYFTAEYLEISSSEYIELMNMLDIIANVIIIIGVIFLIIFLFNLRLFVRLIKEKYTMEQARKIYLYQAIIGVIYLLSNTVVGILYLISGVQGRSGHIEEKNIREGI